MLSSGTCTFRRIFRRNATSYNTPQLGTAPFPPGTALWPRGAVMSEQYTHYEPRYSHPVHITPCATPRITPVLPPFPSTLCRHTALAPGRTWGAMTSAKDVPRSPETSRNLRAACGHACATVRHCTACTPLGGMEVLRRGERWNMANPTEELRQQGT